MVQYLHLVRHGAVLPPTSKAFVGSSDLELTKEGFEQMKRLRAAVKLIGPDVTVCSPRKRTVQSAKLLDLNYDIEPDLREVDFGRWEQKEFSDIADQDPELVDAWCDDEDSFQFPEGEVLADFRKRVRWAAHRLLERPGETYLAVTHGGVIKALICQFLGLPTSKHFLFSVAYGSLTTLRIQNGKGVLTALNVRGSASV